MLNKVFIQIKPIFIKSVSHPYNTDSGNTELMGLLVQDMKT